MKVLIAVWYCTLEWWIFWRVKIINRGNVLNFRMTNCPKKIFFVADFLKAIETKVEPPNTSKTQYSINYRSERNKRNKMK